MIEEFFIFYDSNLKPCKKRLIPLKPRFTAEEIRQRGEVFFQDANTVLKIDGETFIAKPEKCDKFDKEKGLLICLVKALGLTTSDVLELLDGAEVKKSKEKANIIKQDKMKNKKK